MKREKHYRNMHVKCRYADEVERCLRTADECDTLTEAKRRAELRGGYAVRAYYFPDSGDLSHYRIF